MGLYISLLSDIGSSVKSEGHGDLISWSCDFTLCLDDYLLEKCHTWDISFMSPNDWPQNISRSVWLLVHGSVILLYILNTFWWRNVITGLSVPSDPMVDLKTYQDQCDLYFMVQWLCLIYWILFDREMSYLNYKFHVTQWLTWKYV